MDKNDQEERPWRNEWILIRYTLSHVERISPPTLLHHEPRLYCFRLARTKIKPFHESFIVQVLCDCCYVASLIQNLSWQSAKMTFFVCQKQVCILIFLITTASAASMLRTMLLYAIYIVFHFVAITEGPVSVSALIGSKEYSVPLCCHWC